MKSIITFEIRKYNVTRQELIEWADNNKIEVYRTRSANSGNADAPEVYGFEKEEDMVAFSIKFGHSTMMYKPRSSIRIPRGPGTV